MKRNVEVLEAAKRLEAYKIKMLKRQPAPGGRYPDSRAIYYEKTKGCAS